MRIAAADAYDPEGLECIVVLLDATAALAGRGDTRAAIHDNRILLVTIDDGGGRAAKLLDSLVD